MSDLSPASAPPVFEGVRHELKRRETTVASVSRLTPHMIRIVVAGEALADFASPAPDDHVKILVPGPGGEPVMREYTPRAFDPAARTLTLDFAVHEAGPATAWALSARPGDPLTVGGPRGSRVLRSPVARWLLIGDETALPAIARRIEALPQAAEVETLVAVPGPADEQVFAGAARVTSRWLHRPAAQATDPGPFLDALADFAPRPGGFVWIAAEAQAARALRAHLLARGQPQAWMKAAGYWVAGKADASVKEIAD